MDILIVDDHILFREGLASMLGNQPDMNVVGEAGTLRKAIAKAKELEPEVVLMDIGLPDGSGLEAIEQIQKCVPHASIVVLTIYESDEILITSIQKGARGFLHKNTPIADLVASLRGVSRGEAALSRSMTSRVLDEIARISTLIHNGDGDYELEELTSREIEVLAQLTTGASNREIGDKLVIAENTVKAHVRHILKKLNLRNRREAAGFARRAGLVNDHPAYFAHVD